MNTTRYLKSRITIKITFVEILQTFVLASIILGLIYELSTSASAKIEKQNANYQVNKSGGNSSNIYCMILTSPQGNLKRVHAIHSTWGAECNKITFIAKLNETLIHINDLIDIYPFLNLKDLDRDDYKALACKMYHAIRDIYLTDPNYDWYLKTDDDTYIFMDHLREFLSTQNPSEPITFGYNYKVDQGYHSGGAGYVMSREAFKRIGIALAKNISFCRNCQFEDINVNRCLRTLNVHMGRSRDQYDRERFHLFDIQNQFDGGIPNWLKEYSESEVKLGLQSISETSISFHYITGDRIYQLHDLWTKYSLKKRNGDKLVKFSDILYEMLK